MSHELTRTLDELRDDVTPVPVVLAEGALPVKATDPLPVVERRPHFMPTGPHTLQPAAAPVTVLPDLPQRLRAILKNPATPSTNVTVWVGQTQNEATPTAGFPLDPGESIVIDSTATVYAALDPAATVAQAVYTLADQLDG